MIQLDQEAVIKMARDFIAITGNHLGSGSPDRAKVFEVLNAVALGIAPLIAATGLDQQKVMTWFTLALDEAVADFADRS